MYDACLLIVGVEEEDDALADAVAADVFDEVRADAHGAVRDLGEGGRALVRQPHGGLHKMSPMIDAGFFVDTMEVATTWSNLPNLYHEVKRSLGRKAFVMAHFSHGYVPGGSIYFAFAASRVTTITRVKRTPSRSRPRWTRSSARAAPSRTTTASVS